MARWIDETAGRQRVSHSSVLRCRTSIYPSNAVNMRCPSQLLISTHQFSLERTSFRVDALLCVRVRAASCVLYTVYCTVLSRRPNKCTRPGAERSYSDRVRPYPYVPGGPELIAQIELLARAAISSPSKSALHFLPSPFRNYSIPTKSEAACVCVSSRSGSSGSQSAHAIGHPETLWAAWESPDRSNTSAMKVQHSSNSRGESRPPHQTIAWVTSSPIIQ